MLHMWARNIEFTPPSTGPRTNTLSEDLTTQSALRIGTIEVAVNMFEQSYTTGWSKMELCTNVLPDLVQSCTDPSDESGLNPAAIGHPRSTRL